MVSTLTFDSGFSSPYSLLTVSSSSLVPWPWQIGLGGHTYMLDLLSDQTGLRGQYFRRAVIEVSRQQADQSSEPGEHTLSADDLWRRSQSSWHFGSGQLHLDRKDSIRERFSTSKGVDVWTKWQASLLPDTATKIAQTGITNMAATGTALYASTTAAMVKTTDLSTSTACTGLPATINGLASDGTTIYIAGSNGVYTLTNTAASLYGTWAGPASAIGYVKGRLLVANSNILYNFTSAPGATPTALSTLPSGWTWTCFAEGPGVIFAGATSGQRSTIYAITITSDGTALGAPTAIQDLPDGETLTALHGYFGLLVIGSTLGVRIANPSSTGTSLTLGHLITTGASVLCLTAYDRFIYYGLTNYDGTSTGIGRMDLSTATTDALTFAYASDLMFTGQGSVTCLQMWAGNPVFGVTGAGIIGQTTDLVPSGTLTSGYISYDMADPKIPLFIDVKHLPLLGSISTSIGIDTAAGTAVGVSSTAGSVGPTTAYPISSMSGELIEVTQTLAYSAALTTGPTMTRWTLRSYPNPNRVSEFVLPLLLHEVIDPDGTQDVAVDIGVERDFLFGLVNNSAPVTLQMGSSVYQVIVNKVDEIGFRPTDDGLAWRSTTVVRCTQVVI